MVQINSEVKTIICIGSGGVGKTTVSAALGYGLAQSGKKILVMTIDPSQRLSQALKIKSDGEVYQVNENLFACTLNHEKAFQDFVLKSAMNENANQDLNNDIKKLLQNKLFKQLSTDLSGSQDFTALFKLQQFVEEKKYDIVILDTPPAQHTWQFLHAPEKLAQLFNDSVTQWFRDPNDGQVSFFKKMINMGTQQVLKALEGLTGSEFIKELALFFKAIQKWQAPLEQQVFKAQKLLSSQNTEFILVTSLDGSRLTEAQKISQEIYKAGFNLKKVILNRSLDLTSSIKGKNDKLQSYYNYFNDLQCRITQSKSVFGSHLTVYKCQEVVQNNSHEIQLDEIYKNINAI